MSQIVLPERRVQLVSPASTSDLWQDLTGWFRTAGVTRCRGVLIVADLSSGFQVRIGIQTATSDIEVADTPLNPGSGTGLTYLASAGKQYFDFDPTVTAPNNGSIGIKASFRLGLLYSSSSAIITRGDCVLKATYQV